MNDEQPSGLVWKLFQLLLPRDADSIAGDVAEAYQLRAARDGAAAAKRWLRREVAVTLLYTGFARLTRHRLAGVSLLLGTIAGIAFIVLALRFRVDGWRTFALFPGMCAVVAVYLSIARVPLFKDRLVSLIVAFMTMTAFVYVFTIGFYNPAASARLSLWGHVSRLGMMLGIGLAAGVVVALISAPSLRARAALPAVFLPWIALIVMVTERVRWNAHSPVVTGFLPFQGYLEMVGWPRWHWQGQALAWLAMPVNTAVWAALAVLAASLVERRRARRGAATG